MLQLLGNDSHWDNKLKDDIISSSPHHVCTLFAIIIPTCFPSNLKDLWLKYRDDMSNDILYSARCQTFNPVLQITAEIYNKTLIMIEDMCLLIANKVLLYLGLTAPNRCVRYAFNHELRREPKYDIETLTEIVRTAVPKLNDHQRIVYDDLIQADLEGFFFLDAPGGTGKAFLLSLLLAKIRSQNDVALALASSGIAATLLEGE
ncbi:uncharacterized protein LOC113381100 [Ctenocephalides felis]|uniref:uncharacterized protein LOC113381100 n=1 Tax=Ctenocephalides felis TaxID=7515 RepID=UPI000E6E1250|nr:uncharacterized protein LOC113381100 [Ctenocephalides felis]